MSAKAYYAEVQYLFSVLIEYYVHESCTYHVYEWYTVHTNEVEKIVTLSIVARANWCKSKTCAIKRILSSECTLPDGRRYDRMHP